MGAIYIDPATRRATINRDECVECYACYNGLSQEHLNPALVRAVRKMLAAARVRFDPEPDVVAPVLRKLGYRLERAKTNIGLGRASQRRSTVEERVSA